MTNAAAVETAYRLVMEITTEPTLARGTELAWHLDTLRSNGREDLVDRITTEMAYGEPTDRDQEDALPRCQLSGTDGNAFSVIGTVARCLKEAGMADRAKRWTNEAMASNGYDEMLQLAMRYVDAR